MQEGIKLLSSNCKLLHYVLEKSIVFYLTLRLLTLMLRFVF